MLGFGAEMQGMADGVPSGRGNAGLGVKAATAEGSIGYSMQQLDKKFKHASDFGLVTTKKNPETLGQFRSVLQAHAKDSATIQHGTYGFVNGSRVLFNANTNNVVVVDKASQFVTGFKLAPGTPQYQNYLENGILR
jgi:filamentous hemagglutinin